MSRSVFTLTGWGLFLLSVFFWTLRRAPEPSKPEPGVVTVAPAPVATPPQPLAPPVATAILDASTASERIAREVRLLVDKHQPEKALALLEADTTLPESERDLQKGLLYLAIDEPAKAIPLLERSLEASPEQPTVLSALVHAFDNPARRKDGLRFLRDFSARRHPTAMGPAMAYADALARSGQPADAAAYLQSRAPSLADPAEAYSAAGDLWARQGRLPSATQALEVAVRLREQQLAEATASPDSGPSRTVAARALRTTRMALITTLVQQRLWDEAEHQLAAAGASEEDRVFAERTRARIQELRAYRAAN